MNNKVMEFKIRYSGISTRIEVLKLEEEIKEFMSSKDFIMLSGKEMAEIDDLLIEVILKKEYLQTGLDPWRMKQWLHDSKWRNNIQL